MIRLGDSRTSEEEITEKRPHKSSPADGTPDAGFVVKIVANGIGTRHYINMCSHRSVGKPINAQDQEMPDELCVARADQQEQQQRGSSGSLPECVAEDAELATGRGIAARGVPRRALRMRNGPST